MNEDNFISFHLCSLPTEVLLKIFTYLPGKQLIRCRQVCIRWMEIIDTLNRSDVLWHQHCKNDFKDLYKIARQKARPGLLIYNIYKSLSLWPKLSSAREARDEFAAASRVSEEIRDFKILGNGIIGVHKRGLVVYYDIETLQQSKRGTITGEYLTYTENDDTILILNYHLHLFVIRKILHSPRLETNVTFDNVKTFILSDRNIYYVNLNDEIYLCQLDDDSLDNTLLHQIDDSVMCLGFSDNHLHVLTFQRNIYTLVGNNFILTCNLDESSNLLHILRKYNFLETLDWRVYFQWMFVLNHTVPHGPMRDIIVVRSYGDVYFVGSNWGVLRIYYAPYSSGEFDLYSAEPVKQYNFMERYDCPVLSMCPIIQVDVLESEDGHTVLVAMPKKIAILEFRHSYKRSATAAMLLQAEPQNIKILKLDINS